MSKQGFHTLTEAQIWMLIELTYFFYWIMALVVFLFFGFIIKYKSILKRFNESLHENLRGRDMNNQNQVDLWSGRKSDDFLRYLKWEAFYLSYFIC